MQLQFNDIDILVNGDLNLGAVTEIKSFRLDYNGIKSMTISKSYQKHITEISLELDMITTAQLALISSGGCSVAISISSGAVKDKHLGDGENLKISKNVFSVQDISFNNSDENLRPGGEILHHITVKLLSWTLTRMLVENNFGFTSTGSAALGTSNPRTFLLNHLQNEYIKTYTTAGVMNNANLGTQGATDADGVAPPTIMAEPTEHFSMQESTSDLSHISGSAPTTGYILIGDNNFEILKNFFEQYPVYLTPNGWLLDDLPIDVDSPSQLVITDFFIPSSWHRSRLLSNLINGKTRAIVEASRYYSLSPIEIRPYFNKVKFHSYTETPMIQLIQASAGVPTLVDGTLINKTADKFVSDGNSLNLFSIPNPTVKKIYSYMPEQDILKQLSYQRKYKDQNPVYEAYYLNNVTYHDFDMRQALMKDAVVKTDTTIASRARKGPLHRAEWIFKRTIIKTDSPAYAKKSQGPDSGNEVKTFRCHVKVEYLMTNDLDAGQIPTLLNIDKELGDLAGSVIDTIPAGSLSVNGVFYSGSTPYMGELKINGTPGDIAKTGEELISTGFKYLWGGAEPGYYDCSGFVMTAVCAATGLKRWGAKTNKDAFPKGSHAQAAWCQRYAKPIGYNDVQAGDIIFLSTSASISSVHHVGIAKSQTKVMASSSRVSPSRKASTCSKAKPCKGASVEDRFTTGPNGKRTRYWDREFAGAFRIEGHGKQDQPDSPGAGVGVMCQEIAKIESTGLGGGRPEGYAAYNSGSGAKGAYQFLDGTAKQYAKSIGLNPNSPEIWQWYNQDAMCAKREADIISAFKNKGIPITTQNVYIAWQQGSKGAAEILQAAQTGDESLISSTRRNNMISNMHGATYINAQSYVNHTSEFIREKGVDPGTTR